MLITVPLIFAVCVVGICSTVYRDYFVAFGWHLRHGNHTIIEGRRVEVPLFWWREDYFGGGTGLERAATRSPFLNGGSIDWFEENGALEWSPISEGAMTATDEEALKATRIHMEHPAFAEPKYAEVVTLVTLHGPVHLIYCVSEKTSYGYLEAFDYCRMAGSTVVFTYGGNANFEQTAERILSTMK
jgi:hypothetical protein